MALLAACGWLVAAGNNGELSVAMKVLPIMFWALPRVRVPFVSAQGGTLELTSLG